MHLNHQHTRRSVWRRRSVRLILQNTAHQLHCLNEIQQFFFLKLLFYCVSLCCECLRTSCIATWTSLRVTDLLSNIGPLPSWFPLTELALWPSSFFRPCCRAAAELLLLLLLLESKYYYISQHYECLFDVILSRLYFEHKSFLMTSSHADFKVH